MAFHASHCLAAVASLESAESSAGAVATRPSRARSIGRHVVRSGLEWSRGSSQRRARFCLRCEARFADWRWARPVPALAVGRGARRRSGAALVAASRALRTARGGGQSRADRSYRVERIPRRRMERADRAYDSDLGSELRAGGHAVTFSVPPARRWAMPFSALLLHALRCGWPSPTSEVAVRRANRARDRQRLGLRHASHRIPSTVARSVPLHLVPVW